MYSLLHDLLSDKKGGKIFTLFGAWHFFYIVLTLTLIISVLFLFKKKEERLKKRAARTFINIAFGIYVADFFLMPFAYGEIDIEKLPFHACTAMCVICFLSYFISFLEKHRTSFAMLGLISNIVYLVYPAGVMWYAVHPLSYRVIQTLLFHSMMTVYGILTLIYEYKRLNIRKCHHDLLAVIAMTVWALIGNYTYNGAAGGYSKFFNWFFVIRDPLSLIPQTISPLIMPFLNIAAFFAVEMIIHLIVLKLKQIRYIRKSL
jgi:hypothetical protein